MKRYLIAIFSLFYLAGFSQVSVNIQLPPAGLSLKNQLWNILATNSSATPVFIHLELRLTDITRNVQVMNASAAPVSITPGNQFLHAGMLAPIQYNITDPSFQEFAANEFLPMGRFLVCFTIIKHFGDGLEKIGEECDVVEVEPLSPPQLVFPSHQDAIDTRQPVFNWIAPAPATLFSALNYDLEIAEIYPNQTEADAIQQNVPLLRQSGIHGNAYPYPDAATALETGKNYAWRVLAKNGDAVVGRSETWRFRLKESVKKDSLLKQKQPFAKTRRDNQLSYTIATNSLKFEYLNETNDTVWHVRIADISTATGRDIAVSMDSIRLIRGQNLVELPLHKLGGFEHKHIYLLQIKNSRNELWQLKFEYRRKKEEE